MSKLPLQTVFLAAVALLHVATAQAQTPSPGNLASDTSLLKANGLPTEGPGLLQIFRERTLSKEQLADLENQARLLSSPQFLDRKKAEATLLKAGPLARQLLLDLLKKKDTSLETIRRSETLLKKIAEGQDVLLAIASARLVAHAPPPESGKVLLDFIPFAADGRLLEEVQLALNAVAVKDGKVDPTFLAALSDQLPARRAAAGEAIVRGGGLTQRKTVSPLLADEPSVRIAVLMALVEAQDKTAVRTLIDLLPEVPPERVWQVEDLLHKIAGEKGPDLWIGAKTPVRVVQTAWAAWWQTNQQTVSLAKLSEPPRHRSFILLTTSGQEAVKAKRGSKLLEIRPSKQIPWTFSFPRNLSEGQCLGKDRVLVAEGRKVTERDLKTSIFWEREFDDGVVACQRLPGGDTFVATRRQLVLVDPVGQMMFAHKEQKDLDEEADPQEIVAIIGAGRARDGHMVFINQKGQCTWLDREGYQVRSFNVGQTAQAIGTIEVLPGHRIVLPLAGAVVEIDKEGRVVWRATINAPASALRIANGNTLVASGGRVVELDRNGQEVWSYEPTDGMPFRLRRR